MSLNALIEAASALKVVRERNALYTTYHRLLSHNIGEDIIELKSKLEFAAAKKALITLPGDKWYGARFWTGVCTRENA